MLLRKDRIWFASGRAYSIEHRSAARAFMDFYKRFLKVQMIRRNLIMADFKRRFKDLLGFGGNESVAYDYSADDDYDTYYDQESNEEYADEDTRDAQDFQDDMSSAAPRYSARAASNQSSARSNRTEGRSNSFGSASSTSDRSKVLSMGAASNLKVVLSKPMEFNDCQGLCSHLRGHMTVVLNLEFVRNVADRRRIFDFVSGCSFALDCNIQRVSELIYVIAPCDVDVFSEADEEEEIESFAF